MTSSSCVILYANILIQVADHLLSWRKVLKINIPLVVLIYPKNKKL